MNEPNQINYSTGKNTLTAISSANRFNKWMYSEIRDFLKGEIIEIGSGLGNISKFAVSENKKITLSDCNPLYISILEKQFNCTANNPSILNLDLLHPNFKIQYKELYERFDCVFLLNVIEHIKDDKTAINHCKFLLKKTGHLIILAPAYPILYCKLDSELGHYRRYTCKSLIQLLEGAQFSIIANKYFNLLGVMGWLVSGKLMGNSQLGRKEMSVFDNLVMLGRILDKIVFKKAGLSAIAIGKKD